MKSITSLAPRSPRNLHQNQLAKPKIPRKKAEPTKAGTTKDAKATTTGTEQVAATETKKS